jgi:hypothetical protein
MSRNVDRVERLFAESHLLARHSAILTGYSQQLVNEAHSLRERAAALRAAITLRPSPPPPANPAESAPAS